MYQISNKSESFETVARAGFKQGLKEVANWKNRGRCIIYR